VPPFGASPDGTPCGTPVDPGIQPDRKQTVIPITTNSFFTVTYCPPSFLTFVVNDKVNDAVNTMVIYTNGKLKAWEPGLADFLIAQFGQMFQLIGFRWYFPILNFILNQTKNYPGSVQDLAFI
jgi:hypothetical protein